VNVRPIVPLFCSALGRYNRVSQISQCPRSVVLLLRPSPFSGRQFAQFANSVGLLPIKNCLRRSLN
jgi:hypothetical protein